MIRSSKLFQLFVVVVSAFYLTMGVCVLAMESSDIDLSMSPPKSVPRKKTTSLHQCIEYGYNDEVEKFLSTKMVMNATDPLTNRSLLHTAVQYNDAPIVTLLLNKCPSLAHWQDYGGNTPLHIAAGGQPCAENFSIIKRLLTFSGVENARNDLGFSPLHVAVGTGNIMAVVLLAQQARREAEKMEDTASGVRKIQLYLDEPSNGYTREMILDDGSTIKEIKKQETPLDIAISQNNVFLIHYLIQSGAYIDSLHYAQDAALCNTETFCTVMWHMVRQYNLEEYFNELPEKFIEHFDQLPQEAIDDIKPLIMLNAKHGQEIKTFCMDSQIRREQMTGVLKHIRENTLNVQQQLKQLMQGGSNNNNNATIS